MLNKATISVAKNLEGRLLSSLFLVGKNNRQNCSVTNLKELNKGVPYAHFKMKVLFLLKEMPLPEDFMRKTDLNNVYFEVSLSKKSQKYVRY